jgi:DcaP outer membrane protein
MTRRRCTRQSLGTLLMTATLIVVGVPPARAQAPPPDDATPPAATAQASQPQLEVYGFAMLDTGYQFTQNNPDWFDVVRPVKLPAFHDEFGKDGRWFSGVRQSRLGVRTVLPSDIGELKTVFEFELFGTGVDAGQTTFRLRHAYGEVGQVGAGQTWSVFMDTDAFPNSLEYWGPNGLVWFRNIQVRWMPLRDHANFVLGLERPGASGDQGVVANRVELQNVKPRFPLPDLTASYKAPLRWGYVKGAFLLGEMKWDDLLADQFELSGSATRWGINLSSNVKVASDTIRVQYVFGDGIENYMNDAPVDVGVKKNPGNAVTPVLGTALPCRGLSAFYDRTWNDMLTSSIGYSRVDIDNSDGQAANAFKDGQYALFNLLYTPAKNVMVGGEFQWGRRENFSDGWAFDDYRLQFSFRYNFSYKFGG